MGTKVTLTDIASGYDVPTTVNANNDLVEAEFDNSLSLDGTAPNSMGAQLDMNSNRVINVANASLAQDAVTKAQLDAYAAAALGTVDATATTYDQGGTGSVATTVEAKLQEFVSVKDFGAVGNGSTDDTVAIQAAIDSFGSNGGRLYFPPGTYIVSDANADLACLTFQYPIQLLGAGPFVTAIKPADAVGATVNTLVFTPNASFAADFTSIEKIMVGNPQTGARVGNHGVYCTTLDASQNLPKFTMREVYIGDGTGQGFYHLNDATDNPNGGMYAALFDNSVIKGGMKFEESGDSITVRDCLLSGDKIGVDASLVSGAGSLAIIDNNITNSAGAIRIDRGHRFRINGNNIENIAAGAAASNDAAIVNLSGDNGVLYGGEIKGNLVSGFTSTDATIDLILANCRGTNVQDNVFLSGGVSVVTGISIASDTQDVRVSGNTYNAAVTTHISDSGVGTMGLVKVPSLSNSWVEFATGSEAPQYVKSIDGMVHLWGSMKSGTTTDGTTILTLPAGFRPTEIIRAPLLVVNAGTPQLAQMNIESDGVVSITYVLSSDQVSFNITFPADKLAEGTSAE